jgi:7,8-dihydropterin-6-yl-methyl-4-(beta-D-ribofuranosyl)aminobenzene 5'-phosphate synthase
MLIRFKKTEGVFFLKLINVPGKKTKLTTYSITQKWSTYFRVRQPLKAFMDKLLFGLFLFLISLSGFSQEKSAKSKSLLVNNALILFDAFGRDTALTKGWGYSSLIEYNGKNILFDAGSNADLFKQNVIQLGIDLKKVDVVIVSHAHYDHLNGIDYLLSINPKVKIYFPYDVFWGAQSVFNATGQDSLVKDSLPISLRYFDGNSDIFMVEQSGGRFLHANIEFVKDFREIFPGVRLIPTKAKYMGYFSKYPKSFTPGNFNEANEDLKLSNLPELSLSLTTRNGDVLFVGCSHSGVENIIQEAIRKTGNRINLLIGGFHLLPFDRVETIRISSMIKDHFKVAKVAPGHCTGHLAFKIFSDLYKDNFIYAGLGEKISF